MPSSVGKVKPFIVVNRSSGLYGTSGYPVGGVNPPFSPTVSAPAPPDTTGHGPLPGTNCINLQTLRDYYKVPFPPITPLASPPVIAVVSFGGGVYGQPVSSGKYSGFWKCTDISGANGAPIQILVAPLNGAINAPNADDGGATLENTVDVATINTFYGMINQGNVNQNGGSPIYTPPVIILYIAPSDDMSEVYRTFYTVLNNPVVCNGKSYMPSVVCCSWGAPEIAWTQKDPFPTFGEYVDDDPNPAGIAEINEINDLFADAVKRGINICVASGDIPLPANGPPSEQSQSDLEPAQIMFPASSPYVTCVGGSSVFFPNGPLRNFNNPGEFAWARADGGVSTAFPLPDYQANLPGSALISADVFVDSAAKTTELLRTALGVNLDDTSGNLLDDPNGNFVRGLGDASVVAETKALALKNAQATYNSAVAALGAANAASSGDASSLQLQLTVNAAKTALAAAVASNTLAQAALADAQDAVVKAETLDALLNTAAVAHHRAAVQIANDTNSLSDILPLTVAEEIARDAAVLVANKAVAQGAASIFAPRFMAIENHLDETLPALQAAAETVTETLLVPYDSFPVNQPYTALAALYNNPLTDDQLGYLLDSVTEVKDKLVSQFVDASGTATAAIGSPSVQQRVLGTATAAARLSLTTDDAVKTLVSAKAAWDTAYAASNDASGNLGFVLNKNNPDATPAETVAAYARWTAANSVLTAATVVLADAEYAALHTVNSAKGLSSSLYTRLTNTGNYANTSMFSAADISGNLLSTQKDASGADVAMGVVQKEVFSLIVLYLNNLASVAAHDAEEAKHYINHWYADAVKSEGGADFLADGQVALDTATRAAASMNALSVAYNNAMLKAAVSGWSSSDASENIAVALVRINNVVAEIYSQLTNHSDGGDPEEASSMIDAYVTGTKLGSVQLVVALISNAASVNNSLTVSHASLAADSASAKADVLYAEGSVLYLTRDVFEIEYNDANSVAAQSAPYSVYDEFTALLIAANNAEHLCDLAQKAGQIAKVRLSLTTLPVVVNQALLDAQNAAYKALSAVATLTKMINSYAEITPSLRDSAYRSMVALQTASNDSNLATATKNPAPVTAQLIESLQTLVLKAQAAAKLYSENDPTNIKNQEILALWNKAVSAGAKALVAIGTDNELNDDLDAFTKAIEDAFNPAGTTPTGTNQKVGLVNVIPKTSTAWVTANDAYQRSTYVTTGINGKNLTYLMLAANVAITNSWNASISSNTTLPTAAKVIAVNGWNTSATEIETLINYPTGFSGDTLVKPYSLDTVISGAFTKVTGLAVPGSINATVTSAGLTVTAFNSVDVPNDPVKQPFNTVLSVGTVVTYTDTANKRVSVTVTGLRSGSGNATGVYTISGRVNDNKAGETQMTTSTIVYDGTLEGSITGSKLTVTSKHPTSLSLVAGTTVSYFVDGVYKTATLLDESGNLSGSPTATDGEEGDVTMNVITYSDVDQTMPPYITALMAFKAWKLAFDFYNTDFVSQLETASGAAASSKAAAKVAMTLALSSAGRVKTAAVKFLADMSALSTATDSYVDKAAKEAAEAAYAAADNVNMYRCLPDIAMHADADDLPIIFRLNGGNVYVGGTSVAAAMFAGFLGVVQSHNQINYFMNPVLYRNFTYPSPMFYDISGTDELLNEAMVTSRYKWVVEEKLDSQNDMNIHGSYNTRVGLGSIRGDGLSGLLQVPELVEGILSAPYPVYGSLITSVEPPFSTASANVISVYPGTTADIYAYVFSPNAYNPNVTWSCSSPYNATVSQTVETIAYDSSGNPGFGEGEGSEPMPASIFRAVVTGLVPVDPLAPVPVITISSTDGSNVFTIVQVRVLPAVQVTGVSISSLGETKNPANTVLYLGKTLQLISTVSPASATNKAVYWWSSNMSVVNVDVNGLITPLSPGQATIRVTTVNNNISASISVYVPTPMTGIQVMPSMVTLNPNLLVYPLKNTQLIKTNVAPANVDYKYLRWHVVSSEPLALPPGTTDQMGNTLLYNGSNDPKAVPVVKIHDSYDVSGNLARVNGPQSAILPGGTVLKRDSNGNVVDNTQDTVTALTNGRAVIRVSTDGVPDTVYGTYSADVTVNVVTPVTNVTLQQTNMVIALNPSVKVAGAPVNGSVVNFSDFMAVNPGVNVQYGTTGKHGVVDFNATLPWLNAALPDRTLVESYDVTATLFPAFPSNMNLMWSSSNPKVAIVSNNTPPVLNTTGSDPNVGFFQVTEKITPLSNGSTVIKVTTADGAKVTTVNVVVTTPVTGIVLTPMPVTLNPGTQYALQATVLPTTATNLGLVWSSTNTAVAVVDQNGVVTAVASGSCGISVSTAEGDYTAMATINVVTPLVGVSLVLNTPTPIHIGDMVQILVVVTPTTTTDQAFTWTVTNGVNGNIFTNGPAQNGNIVYLDAAQAGSSVFTVTTRDGNKQASLALTVVPY